jgi:hypothetical protein
MSELRSTTWIDGGFLFHPVSVWHMVSSHNILTRLCVTLWFNLCSIWLAHQAYDEVLDPNMNGCTMVSP